MLLFALCIRWKWFILRFGVHSLQGIQVLCLVRLVCFFEVPMTSEVSFPQVLNPLVDYMITREGNETHPNHIAVVLLIIWILGATTLWCVSVARQIRWYRFIRNYSERFASIPYESRQYRVRIVIGPAGTSPFTIGVFRPVIVLPAIAWETKQLHLVLEHEFIHVKCHHTLQRMLLCFLSDLFWWNPICRLFCKDAATLMELHSDSHIMKGKDKAAILEYCDVLLYFSRRGSTGSFHRGLPFARRGTAPFRFHLILDTVNSTKSQKPAVRAIFICLLVIIFLATYAVIIQPYYSSTENDWRELGSTGNGVVMEIQQEEFQIDWETLLTLQEAEQP